MRTATAYANTNIAFIKYWGKVQTHLHRNLPAVGSLSMTLDDIGTTTSVEASDKDSFTLNGVAQTGEAAEKVYRFLDRVAQELGVKRVPVTVTSANTVPTAAGLASSASAFAALALAASHGAGVDLNGGALSGLARQGSASAARSVFGGFVELPASTGEEVLAEQVREDWDVRLVVAKTTTGEKSVHSRQGMQHTALTSTYYEAWVKEWRRDFDTGKAALLASDLNALGEAMEHSTLAMHATTFAARPPFFYFNGATLEVFNTVWALRKKGTAAYFTADAGPHVKVLCAPQDVDAVIQAVSAVPGVLGTAVHKAGKGARLL